MIGVRITVSEAELRQALRRIGQVGRNPRAFLLDVGEELVNSTQDRILAGGPGPDGASWPAWSLRYAARRNALGGRGGLLNLRGRLLASIVKQVQGAQLRVGTNAIYSRIQQFGGGGIPPRAFLGISPADRREILAIFEDHARRAAGR